MVNVSSVPIIQVELAHGGRGPPPSSDRRGGYGGSGGGRHGISRHSEYRGATKAVMFYYITKALCSSSLRL